jgi:glutathione reductase (NADPH)
MSAPAYDLLVIGAGSGGVRAARVAASLGARVAIIEAHAFGGTCVNVGCIPKKLLVYASEFPEQRHDASFYGWTTSRADFDWPALIRHKNREITRLNGIYERMLVDAGVEIVRGHARFVDPHTLDVNGRRLRGAHILIATGGEPYRLHIPGRELGVTSDDVFYLESLPRSVAITGGGYIAVEFAMVFRGLGVETHLVFRADRVLRGFDDDVRDAITRELLARGVRLHSDAEIVEFRDVDGATAVLTRSHEVRADLLVHATGRRALVERLALDAAGVELDTAGFIRVDAELRTSAKHIFAAGDVVGHLALTPIALAEGTFVARHLFGEGATPVDYELVPTAVFGSPPVATVGLTEAEARERYRTVKVFMSTFRPLKLTLTDRQERTMMKLVVDAETDRVVGCHMVGADAGEIVQGLAVAMKAGATKAIFDATIGIHPTAAEEFVTMREPVR